jgi:hypothetical protein
MDEAGEAGTEILKPTINPDEREREMEREKNQTSLQNA